ncbi:hypothetical protein [Peredibacter starrii]|uniref:VWFA domain-containing protein n=1 Tax=Peredibacter starrii TaxID=28202 RepID=A0AAX4HVP5_9BACT|nr:hypothetical protein [Peredibacter starrii]WPU67065.1 hypothetical protein SOO65_09900 [Peredibacter starrii]
MKTRVTSITNLMFSLTFCLGLASCNKDEFYQKEFLDNPYQPDTTGSVNGGGQGGLDAGSVGGTQGGVDNGVDGGTSGSTTGSSTGGVDGSATTGGTVGGVDGSTTGGSVGGSVVGGVDGSATTGGVDGSTTGGSTGSTTGSTVGGVDGSTTSGSTTGSTTSGSTTGSTTSGSTTGSTVGGVDGSTTGGTTGSTTGSSTGGYLDCNQGHGNDADGVDESNPTIGTDPRCKKETFRQANSQTKKLDIVWIIDNSGSMSDEQEALGDNFSAFIEDFITKDVDFKMAITTTDTSSSSKKGQMVYGSDTKLTSAKAKLNEAQFMRDFKSLVRVGTSGSGYEKGLEASEGFMQKYASSWVRPDAYLAVVVLSDEEDQSSKSVKAYTDYLKSFKSEAGLVKMYSIVDVGMSNVGSNGVTTGYQRYADASKNTAGIVADIRDDFYKSLDDMGESIIKLLDSFALANEPVPGTLKVYVNGVESSNYTYDAATHSIKFDQGNLPPVGAEITVTYVKQ